MIRAIRDANSAARFPTRTSFHAKTFSRKDMAALVCDDCMYEVTSKLPEVVRKKKFDYACDALAWHFRRHSAGSVGLDLAAIPRSYGAPTFKLGLTGCSPHSPIRFFGIPRGAPLRDIEHRGTDQR